MTTIVILAALAVAAIPDFQGVIDRNRVNQSVPGVSAVVTRQHEVIFAGASGVADLETDREMTADTVLYAGSLTKILTAVLTLQLVEEGELSLQDVVSGIAVESSGPGVSPSIFHLLTHSSGLDREGDFGYWFSANFPDEEELAGYLAGTELRTTPGETVRYSNIGFAALGPVIERASGQTYADALQSRIFGPLGMTSSGAPGPAPNVAVGYSPVGRLIPNENRPFAGIGNPVDGRHIREYHNAGAMTPAFGAYTTARDLARLAQFLLGYDGDAVFSDDMRSLMLTPQVSGRAIGLRIGQLNGRRVARHDGWFAAQRSHLLLDLEARIGVVVLANSDSASPGKIAESLLTVALKFATDMEQENQRSKMTN